MRIIGLDPGIEKTGFAILEIVEGKLSLLDCGCITTHNKENFSHRLNTLATDLKKIIRQWKPTSAGLEQVFFSKNVKTALKVSHARGVIMELLEKHGIPIFEFNPSHIKIAVTGYGKADKVQIQKMLHSMLGVSITNDDTADAIACGITLLMTTKNY